MRERRILLVGASDSHLDMSTLLGESVVARVSAINEVVSAAKASRPDLVVVGPSASQQMSEVRRRLNDDPDTGDIPIVKLDAEHAPAAPGTSAVTRASLDAVSLHLELSSLKRENQALASELKLAHRARREQAQKADVAFRDEVNIRRLLQQRQDYLMRHDLQTGLLNRAAFVQQLRARLPMQCPPNVHSGVVLHVDLDHFRALNESAGQAAGDATLLRIAQLLQAIAGDDLIARIGSNAFLIFSEGSLEDGKRMGESIRLAIESLEIRWAGNGYRMTASVGVAPLTGSRANATETIGLADSICHAAKVSGRNVVRVHDPDRDTVEMIGRALREAMNLSVALRENRFRLYRQSIVRLDGTEEGERFELLVRMIHQDGGLVAPEHFIPIAERFDLIRQLDRWVIANALDWLGSSGASDELLCCSINLSGQSLCDTDFMKFIEAQLASSRVAPGSLCFEVTETAAVVDLDRCARSVAKLRRMGCAFALDDFGTGFSSYAYLKALGVDYLKIDGMFVRDMVHDQTHAAMVRSMNEIGHVTGVRTIAEYVENDEIAERLRRLGVDYGQGYGFHRPEPIDAGPLLAV